LLVKHYGTFQRIRNEEQQLPEDLDDV